MCNCGRTRTDVVTSANLEAEAAQRAAQDTAANEAILAASAANAVANAGGGSDHGWYLVTE